jgi:hypothetical protein
MLSGVIDRLILMMYLGKNAAKAEFSLKNRKRFRDRIIDRRLVGRAYSCEGCDIRIILWENTKGKVSGFSFG